MLEHRRGREPLPGGYHGGGGPRGRLCVGAPHAQAAHPLLQGPLPGAALSEKNTGAVRQIPVCDRSAAAGAGALWLHQPAHDLFPQSKAPEKVILKPREAPAGPVLLAHRKSYEHEHLQHYRCSCFDRLK